MAYQNTGYARNKTLTLTKGVYEQSYTITDSFTDPSNSAEYEALSNQDFQRLTEEEYLIRGVRASSINTESTSSTMA